MRRRASAWTETDLLEIEDIVSNYEILPAMWIRSDAAMVKLRESCVVAYVSACCDMESVREVHAAVMRNESKHPMPATIRHWIRELNLVELDINAEAGA